MSTIGDRAFPVTDGHVWKSLPKHDITEPPLPKSGYYWRIVFSSVPSLDCKWLHLSFWRL